jgi:hypothetical protein
MPPEAMRRNARVALSCVWAGRTRQQPTGRKLGFEDDAMPSDQEFLLFPLDTGEDPACMDCGTLMTVAGQGRRFTQAGFWLP